MKLKHRRRFGTPAALLSAGLLALLTASCAHVEAPRGGPEDTTPPMVIVTRPAADALVPGYDGAVVFLFDERISEQRITESALVSPRTSPVDIRHGRQEIRVSLRRGWQRGMIYHVTLRPTVSDLFGNALGEPVTLVFSTGPAIPETEVSGRILDRLTAAAEAGARVEAIRTADSLVYAVPTDSAGRFRTDRIPEGDYLIRAFRDLNENRALDPFEQRDSAFASVVVGEPVSVELRLLMPDTTPPVATSASVRGEAVEVEFDDHLDPEQEISPPQVTIAGPDGTIVPVTSVAIGGAVAPAGAPAGTAGQQAPGQVAPGQLPGQATPGQTPGPAVPGQVPGQATPGQTPGQATPGQTGPGAQPPGQTIPGQPAPGLTTPGQAAPAQPPVPPPPPLPAQTLRLELAEGVTLTPGEYVVQLRGIRNVNGLVGDSETTLTVEPPPDPPAAP